MIDQQEGQFWLAEGIVENSIYPILIYLEDILYRVSDETEPLPNSPSGIPVMGADVRLRPSANHRRVNLELLERELWPYLSDAGAT